MTKYQNEKKEGSFSEKSAEKRKLLVQVEDSLNTLNPKLKNSIKYIIKKK